VTSGDHGEALLAGAALGALDGLSWPAALRVGAWLGAGAGRLGIRRRVALANLALAFPELPPGERAAILERHYREVGRIAAEYGRLPRLARAADDEVVVCVDGVDVVRARAGRGLVLVSGHLGNFELGAAWLTRLNPVDFLVRPLRNPAVDARVTRLRRAAGVGVISTRGGVKQLFRALQQGRWVTIAGDQDAGRHGLFVPFFGRLASTAEGAARLALQAGVELVVGTIRRQPDGRHLLAFTGPGTVAGGPTGENVRALTAWHTAVLEQAVRGAPEHYFWLHRRWKTRPADEAPPREGARA